jgi:hypothetical protein
VLDSASKRQNFFAALRNALRQTALRMGQNSLPEEGKISEIGKAEKAIALYHTLQKKDRDNSLIFARFQGLIS